MTQGTKLLGVIDLDSSEPLTVEERKALSLASMACLLEDGQLGKLGALISRYEAAVEAAVEAERKACAEHYLTLYRNASERREFELKILRERFDQLMTNFVQSQINPPVKLMADGESFEAGRVMEREACAQICAQRAKDFQDLFEKYGHEHDDGARVGASQCESLIRARGKQ